jgi:putative ABC transport system permease protein
MRSAEPEWVELLGVVSHQRLVSLDEAGREEIFVTDGYRGHGVVTRWALRTTGEPAKYAEVVRTELDSSIVRSS